MKALGRHLVVEMWGCNDTINDPEAVRRAMLDAVQAAGATLLDLRVHTFSPYGVTGVAVLAESHLSVHTWPEYGYAAVDIFTCGPSTHPEAAVEVLERYFAPEHLDVQQLARGTLPSWTTTSVGSETLQLEPSHC